MNKEFIGKKRFYLENKPDNSMIVRLYVVETRQNEYFTAVLDNGDSFQIDVCEGPDGIPLKTFVDFDNKTYAEYPTLNASDIKFFDKNSDEIGVGEVSMIKIGSKPYFMGEFIVNRSFKYKSSGWDFKVNSGEKITTMLEINDTYSSKAFSWDDYVSMKKGSFKSLECGKYQIWCNYPNNMEYFLLRKQNTENNKTNQSTHVQNN